MVIAPSSNVTAADISKAIEGTINRLTSLKFLMIFDLFFLFVFLDNFSKSNLQGGVYFVNTLPLTGSGKVKRAEVQKIAIELYEAQQRFQY